MARIFEKFFSTGGRWPTAFIDQMMQASMALLDRPGRRRQKRDDQLPGHYRSNNHLRQDIGLPPVNRAGWPY